MNNKKIAIIGLGYVGLPLAVEFGKARVVVGFDTTSLELMTLKMVLIQLLKLPLKSLKMRFI